MGIFEKLFKNKKKVQSEGMEQPKGYAHDYKEKIQSIGDYTKVIEINPKDANAYDNRGFIYFVNLGNEVKGCAD